MLSEITINLHMHTRYSDGHGAHADIGRAAIAAGIDVVIVTDHNVLVRGPEGYFSEGSGRVLMLIGEEVHDTHRDPQKNHLLVFNARKEMAPLAADPQQLIDGVAEAGGLCFLAHPFDTANRTFNETDITWENWRVSGYTGVELWNGLSEFKSRLKSRLHAIFYAFNPGLVPHAPPADMLARWDELLAGGRQVVAIGGSDAHQLPGRMGPFRKTIFPYRTHFRAINTHLLLEDPLRNDEDLDRRAVFLALAAGHAFIANDLPARSHGFRFTGQGEDGDFMMGDEVRLHSGVTMQIRLPQPAECRLLKDGRVYRKWENRDAVVVNTGEPGVYRVEVYLRYRGKRRGWIYSNPVYVR